MRPADAVRLHCDRMRRSAAEIAAWMRRLARERDDCPDPDPQALALWLEALTELTLMATQHLIVSPPQSNLSPIDVVIGVTAAGDGSIDVTTATILAQAPPTQVPAPDAPAAAAAPAA